MIRLHRIADLSLPALVPFASLTDVQLRSPVFGGESLIVVESPKVIQTALLSGLEPVSLLCEERHIEGDAAPILSACSDLDVYVGPRPLLASLTGYTLTRGVLCAFRRPAEPQPEEVLADARRVALLHGVCDTTNIGAIFRSAAALGLDAVVLSRDTCDPFNRRSIRVSMGSVFLVPWTFLDTPLATLRAYGFHTAAMALRDESVPIDHPDLIGQERLALILGTEGDGLPDDVIAAADSTIRIPMHHHVDSLNVAMAATIAFWVHGQKA